MNDQTPYSQYSGNPYPNSGPNYEQIPQQQEQIPFQPQLGQMPQQNYPPVQQPPWQPPQQNYPPVQQPPLYPPPAYPYAPYPGYVVVAPPTESGSGLAIAGFILGILSVVSFFVFYISIPVAIVGIVLSLLGRRSFSRRTLAIWGLVLSIIGLLLAVGFILFFVILAVSQQPRTP